MINVAAHERAANNLRGVKSSIESLVETLRSAQSNIYVNEVDGLDVAAQQLDALIAKCLNASSSIDSVANAIVAEAQRIYREEMEALRRAQEAARKKSKSKNRK